MGQAAAPFTALLPMTPRIPGRSEPDSSCFVSFTLFSLLLEGQFCFVVLFWFFFFLQCHRLPCSSFIFLIEECIYRCPFLYFFFIVINFGLM